MPIANYYWKDLKSFVKEWIYINLNRKKTSIFQDMNNDITKDKTEAIQFTLENVAYLIGFLPNKDVSFLKNKVFLEIGPGQDFGIALILIGLGLKKCVLIDPYLIPWKENYHLAYYSELLIEGEKKFPASDFSELKSVIKNKSHSSPKLDLFNFGVEAAQIIPSESIDISWSNACFEHFVNPEKAVREIARITKKGGVGFHQIDLRDHRNYSKPLEFLTMPNPLFNSYSRLTNAFFGNRLRCTEYIRLIEKNGFKVEFKPNEYSDNKYVKELRLRAINYYKEMSEDELSILGGRFFLEKY